MTTIRQDLWELITLQDSITHLNVTGQAGPVHAPTPEYARLQKRRDALQEQIARRVEWISVEERLPETGPSFGRSELVLALNTGICVVAQYDSEDAVWRWAGAWQELCSVTHWMPLPEPPELD